MEKLFRIEGTVGDATNLSISADDMMVYQELPSSVVLETLANRYPVMDWKVTELHPLFIPATIISQSDESELERIMLRVLEKNREATCRDYAKELVRVVRGGR